MAREAGSVSLGGRDRARHGGRVDLVVGYPCPDAVAAARACGSDDVAVGARADAELDPQRPITRALVTGADVGNEVGRAEGHEPAQGDAVDHGATEQVVHRPTDLACGEFVAGDVEETLGHLVASDIAVHSGADRLHVGGPGTEHVAGQVVADGHGHLSLRHTRLGEPQVGLAPALVAVLVEEATEKEVGFEPGLLGSDRHAEAVVALGHRSLGDRREGYLRLEELKANHRCCTVVPIRGAVNFFESSIHGAYLSLIHI